MNKVYVLVHEQSHAGPCCDRKGVIAFMQEEALMMAWYPDAGSAETLRDELTCDLKVQEVVFTYERALKYHQLLINGLNRLYPHLDASDETKRFWRSALDRYQSWLRPEGKLDLTNLYTSMVVRPKDMLGRLYSEALVRANTHAIHNGYTVGATSAGTVSPGVFGGVLAAALNAALMLDTEDLYPTMVGCQASHLALSLALQGVGVI